MTAFTCTKHNEYCPEGVCRWCEPVGDPGFSINSKSFVWWRGRAPSTATASVSIEQIQETMNRAWAKLVAEDERE